IFIDEVNVSGMTKEEAAKAVEEFVETLRQKEVAITVGDQVAATTLGKLGYTYELNDVIEQAYAIGRSGNLIKRYKEIKDIEQGTKVFTINFKLDDSKLENFISKEVGAFNVAPENASVSRKNGKMIYTDHKVGSK